MKKREYRKAAAALLAAMAVTAAARAGGSDTLVTRAWLEQNLTGWARTAQTQALDGLEQEVLAAAEEKLAGQAMTQAQMDELARQAAAAMASGGSRTVTLERGQRVTGPLGGGMVLESGTAAVDSFTGNDLIDITAGSAAVPGAQASVGSYYMVGIDNGCGLTVTSETAVLRLLDGAFTKESYRAQYEAAARQLCEMGIFRGSDKGFELERAPTRQEALILLIRLLGEEEAALAFDRPAPFADLTGWADGKRYVAYGAHMGYTNGVTADTFNQYGAADRHVYLTYVLRALGYSDRAGDFVWNTTSDSLAVEAGLLTRAQLEEMKASGFYRDHAALISRGALRARLKDGSMTLGERLAMAGVISWDDYYSLP